MNEKNEKTIVDCCPECGEVLSPAEWNRWLPPGDFDWICRNGHIISKTCVRCYSPSAVGSADFPIEVVEKFITTSSIA